ncbi:hypothetical protein CIW47_25940 [Mycolicibacterium sp. P1-5]|nr:hypothetical protein CIW47_25940 [Mycolicibacterium sp. P1-5]
MHRRRSRCLHRRRSRCLHRPRCRCPRRPRCRSRDRWTARPVPTPRPARAVRLRRRPARRSPAVRRRVLPN